MIFKSLADYLDAFAEGRAPSLMPIPLVAAHLDRTSSAVSAMIRAGKLREVRIERNRFVDVSSLLEREEERDSQIDTVERYLVKTPRRRIGPSFMSRL